MGLRIRTLCLLVSLSYSLLHCSVADAGKGVPSVMVVGTVICNSCFDQEISKSGHIITGASVAVECEDATTKSSFRKLVKTNRRGVFRVRMPPQVASKVKSIQSCSVTLIKSSQPFCTVASSANSSQLRFKSRRNGLRIFSAGFFTFKPLKQQEFCNQKPKAEIQPALFFPPSIPFLPPPSIGGVPLPPNPLQPPLLPPIPLLPSPPPLLPPIPLLPSPPPLLPTLPLLPPIPLLPSPAPLLPTLPLLPPIPLLPSPSPLLPPLPFQPVPPPFFSLPPIPLLTPPPPPPAFIFPPFPFPPLFPGIPPASHSEESTSP